MRTSSTEHSALWAAGPEPPAQTARLRFVPTRASVLRARMIVASVLLVVLPAPALCQEPGEDASPVPDPPSTEPISDLELIRWAANEVRLHERRAPVQHAPVPPDSYVGTGVDGPLALPGDAADGLRILAELGGGTLGLLAGGGVGGLIVWAAVESDATPTWMMVAVGTGAALGAAGVTAGVVLAGDATGGQGNFGHAFIGQLMGSVAALPLVTLGMANDAPAVAVVAVGVLPLAGAMLGYEISHAAREGALRRAAFVRPTLGGAPLGMAGELP